MPDRLHNFKSDYGMALRGVRPNDKNAVSVPDFGDGVGHGSAAEGCDQTGHGGGMSETGTVVNIVSAQYSSGKFLGNIVFLISALG